MQTLSPPFSAPKALRTALALALVAALAVAVWAQVGGERGIAPVAATSDIAVAGIEVDVRGDTSEEARLKGWEEAQRLAWEKLDGPSLSDSQIAGLVSSIEIQREQIGPKRYIATLAVIFDRQRSRQYLGGEERARKSAPMLLVPVTMSAGTQLVYETRNPWQRAWAGYQAGSSRIDYVRPAGAGGESLLITYGQTGRRSRTWWRNVLDQFEAADVLTPVANLRYRYPGGPVEGEFTARYGPDDTFLESFRMTARSPEELPTMLDQAVERFDAIYEKALADGVLRVDPTLNISTPDIDPALARLLAVGRAAAERERALAEAAANAGNDGTISTAPVLVPPPEGSVALYTVQVVTPDAASFGAALSNVRGASGVRSVGTRSTAIGGTSVLTVSFSGSIAQLADALRARGYTVQQAGGALVIRR